MTATRTLVNIGLIAGLLFLVSLLISALITLLSIVATIITLGLVVLLLGGITYAVASAIDMFPNTNTQSETTEETERTQDDRIAELKQQRLNGEITDEEFEKRLELELSGPDETEIEHEVQKQKH